METLYHFKIRMSIYIPKFHHIVTIYGIKLNNLTKKDSVKSNLRICTIFFANKNILFIE